MSNNITINIHEIRKSPDGSITDAETIRQIVLTRDKSLFDKIDMRFLYAGLYPEVMTSFNIIPEKICVCESKGKTVWRISSDGKCLRCGEKYKS